MELIRKMGKLKFDEFYLENDKNYSVNVYWEEFDLNRTVAERKYDGHMFCTLCHFAPLTADKGNERRYLKVYGSVWKCMDKHDPDCSYRRDEATKKETEMFYQDLNNSYIKNRLSSCMNRM